MQLAGVRLCPRAVTVLLEVFAPIGSNTADLPDSFLSGRPQNNKRVAAAASPAEITTPKPKLRCLRVSAPPPPLTLESFTESVRTDLREHLRRPRAHSVSDMETFMAFIESDLRSIVADFVDWAREDLADHAKARREEADAMDALVLKMSPQ